MAHLEKDRSRAVDQLEHAGIPSSKYLWPGGSCVFPGIRRFVGKSENPLKRKSVPADRVKELSAVFIDDNLYNVHLWSFLLRGKKATNEGPPGHSLSHIFEHKDYNLRSPSCGLKLSPPPDLGAHMLSGLYSSVANLCYTHNAITRPTDFPGPFKRLLQRQAIKLYSSHCNILPEWARLIDLQDEWELADFSWPEPVGTLDNAKLFLKFRETELERLFAIARY